MTYLPEPVILKNLKRDILTHAKTPTVKPLMLTVVHSTALATSLKEEIVPVHRFAASEAGAAAVRRGNARMSEDNWNIMETSFCPGLDKC